MRLTSLLKAATLASVFALTPAALVLPGCSSDEGMTKPEAGDMAKDKMGGMTGDMPKDKMGGMTGDMPKDKMEGGNMPKDDMAKDKMEGGDMGKDKMEMPPK